MDISEKIQELEDRIEHLESLLSAKKKPKRDNSGRLKALNQLDLKIKDTLDNQAHPVLEGLDLVYTDNLCTILENVHSDISYFSFNKLDSEEERTKKRRSIAARMRKLGYTSLRSRYHKSKALGSTTRAVWVLNNTCNYEEFPETELTVLADTQWKAAFDRMYNSQPDEEVTFL